ncbi:methyl-accepting chemotaxis protein [Albimonas pacifica]|uniref:Methyl-accepting chemotaxis protein n=1 Tax=Albimonas pacifica TaxID=1114924 RepID=A0A1I3LNA6_9RHOB|nr:methyl-accepting chemotaxis protein [Albimonas pacifica]SFI86030.1 methyl-accepting chemotaxis protein [Albimonas pacifica]
MTRPPAPTAAQAAAFAIPFLAGEGGLAESRRRMARALGWFNWMHLPVLSAIMLATGGPALWIAGLSLALCLLAEGVARADARLGRIALATALIGQSALFVGGLAGHPWQVDAHLYFFAVLAFVGAMTDLTALLAAAGAIALHHLSLSVAVPALLFPGGGDLSRTLFHAWVVALETALLSVMAQEQVRLDRASAAAQEHARAEAEAARDAQAERLQAERDDQARRERTAAMMDRLFRELVDQGVAGDFSGRIAERIEEPVLQRLADGLNRLYGELDQVFDELETRLGALADGDLTAKRGAARVGRFGVIQSRLGRTAEQLAELAGGIASAVDRARAASDDIERSADAVAGRAESQAASLEETAATMEEISSTVASSAERLGEAEALAAEITRRTATGEGAAREAVSAVGRIEESASKISDIISVIDSIAFQTNLLALNAAVEAARAGEAGKGFAVVAAEVRTLAQRSSDAAKDIAGLIQESAGHVGEGVRLVQRTGESLGQITGGIDDLARVIGAIATAGREQSQGVSEVNVAVSQLDGATQENAAAAERAASAVRELRAEIAELSDLVGRFVFEADRGRRAA